MTTKHYPRYGWIVTEDHTIDTDATPEEQAEETRVDTLGPRGIVPEIEQRLRNGEGRVWKCCSEGNDGEEVNFVGRIIIIPFKGDDPEFDGYLFAPLDDLGMPDAGSTSIYYQNEDGSWSML